VEPQELLRGVVGGEVNRECRAMEETGDPNATVHSPKRNLPRSQQLANRHSVTIPRTLGTTEEEEERRRRRVVKPFEYAKD